MMCATKKSETAAEELMKENVFIKGKGQRGNYIDRPLQNKNRKKNKKKGSGNPGDVEVFILCYSKTCNFIFMKIAQKNNKG